MTPYISVIFVNRNDNYGGDQEKRFHLFLQYYAKIVEEFPDLFEFLICDWNTPKDRPSLKDQYDWSVLKRVRHFVVPENLHLKLCPSKSRPILDYVGRNVLIRRANAPFVMIINQDIFISRSIAALLSRRNLSQSCFYRADRLDFDASSVESIQDVQVFEKTACEHIMTVHMRPNDLTKPMSHPVDPQKGFETYMTKALVNEKLAQDGIIYGKSIQNQKLTHLFWKVLGKMSSKIRFSSTSFYKRYFLHTNASGDFLIASKAAFEKVHGFVESSDFYMHTDSYICVQLFAAGFTQAILSLPHKIFHNDHSRADREDRSESMTYADHVLVFEEILLNKKSYFLNDGNWGLYNEPDLITIEE